MNKTLYFIRHAQAEHNVALEKHNNNKDILIENKYFDSKLSKRGREQRRQLLNKDEIKEVDIIFVSPLTRTLETAEILCNLKKPIVALELVRERLGVRPCDKRRSITEQKERFIKIDFSLCEDDEDKLWKLNHRETEEELKQRIINFLEWVKKTEYKKIAIITHNGYILRLCNKVLNIKVEKVKNCDIFKIEL